MQNSKLSFFKKPVCRLFCHALVYGCFFLSTKANAQIGSIKFEQLDSLQKIERRPVVVFLHTVWCKYCGAMKNVTFRHKQVAKLLGQRFYFISLDAETKDEILFCNRRFRYKPTGSGTGIHELAEQLGTVAGQVVYPTLCFLSAEYEIIYQQQGYVTAKELLFVLSRLEGL